MNSGDQMLSVSEVAKRLAICARGVRRLVAEGEFARPVKVGASSRWFESDIFAYLEKLKSERDGTQRRTA
ncbi:MAG: helix-turn-helix transcriptional regulator [Verrucomicrobiales bacterium]